MTDWSDPASRLALIERVGPDEYNRRHAEHVRQSTVETVNGHAIRRVVSQRWGVVFMVDGAERGHATLEGAREIANNAR